MEVTEFAAVPVMVIHLCHEDEAEVNVGTCILMIKLQTRLKIRYSIFMSETEKLVLEDMLIP